METVLGNMGIELTDKELSQLVKNLPVDSEYLNKNVVIQGSVLLTCENL